MRKTVLEMVHQVVSDSKEKMAEAGPQGIAKTASVATEPEKPVEKTAGQYTIANLEKLADACEYLSDHIHDINDERSPKEKLASLIALKEDLSKEAFEVGGNAPPEPSQKSGEGDKGPHQTTKSTTESDPPASPALDDGVNPGGPSSAMKAEETNSPGTGIEAGQGGAATPAKQSPKSVTPDEKANPQDAANALETNKEMMKADQPEDILKQAARLQKLVSSGKVKAATANALLRKQAGLTPALAANAAKAQAAQDPAKPGAETATGESLKKKAEDIKLAAAMSGLPPKIASAFVNLLTKEGEDALNPAKIAGGTEPLLQSAQGAPSQLMQGTEAGEGTPRETAPTSGEGGGRELLSSNESAMNATKGKAKAQNKGALAEVLTEPAQSAAHDNVLQKSLDNTSSAGVKISAARELIRKYAAQSPEHARKVAALAKLAQEDEEAGPAPAEPTPEGEIPPELAAAMAQEAGGPAPEGMPAEMPEGGPEGAPSEEALQAADAGVTPEELAEAEMLLAAEEEAAAEAEEAAPPPAEAETAPEAGPPGEAAPKESNVMMGYGGGGAGALPPPTGM